MESLIIFPFVMLASVSSRAFAIAKGKMSVKDVLSNLLYYTFPKYFLKGEKT